MAASKAVQVGSDNLTLVPTITFGFVEEFVKKKSKSQGTKEITKGYKYFCGKYVTNIRVHVVDKGCLIKAKCHRSQKKNESPHDLEVTLLEGSVLQECKCSCAIGISGSCGHVVGLLYSLAHMKTSNMTTVPTDVLKTSLLQTWHIPRGEKLCGSKSDDIVLVGYNAESPRQQHRGLRSTLYNPVRCKVSPVSELCQALSMIDNTCLLLSVIDPSSESTTDLVETKFGKFPKGSPIGVQQKMSSQFIYNILDAPDFPALPIHNYMKNNLHIALDQNKSCSFSGIHMSQQECSSIEEMTRLQASDPKWHAVRKDRLTASVAGDIVKRRADNEPLVARLKTTRKVMTESMRHGVQFEAVAANAFVQRRNGNLNIYPCGIVVSPFAPWLAASPDRKVYDPEMIPPHGLLEIKCPVKPFTECLYFTSRNEDRKLKHNHNYYYQIMMQLAVTGLKWCYFFVWHSDECHEEVIEFDEDIWNDMKEKLDLFYFNHFLM